MQTINQRRALIQITGPAYSPFRDYAEPKIERVANPAPMAVPTRATTRRRSLLRFAVGLLIVSAVALVGLAIN